MPSPPRVIPVRLPPPLPTDTHHDAPRVVSGDVPATLQGRRLVLLFIDELYTIVGAGAAEGAMDAGNMLKPAVARGELHVIGATTLDEYRTNVERDAAPERRFQPLIVHEQSVDETIQVLLGLKDRYEAFHRVRCLSARGEAKNPSGPVSTTRFLRSPAGSVASTDLHRDQALEGERRTALWCYSVVALLGIWLATSPFTFGYDDPAGAAARAAEVTAQRGLAPVDDRVVWSTVNDVVSGVGLVILAAASLRARWLWAPWATCLLGVWIAFAPLPLWAPSAAAYANETIVGALVIALTILIPGMPGMAAIMQPGPETPPGWSYNPSSWWQRAPIIALGFVGYFFARYLAAYQFGYIDWAHDWFFGNGTVEILDSDISRAWPISDAGLGVFAYSIEALMGFMGGTDRWRTMPWMVTFFGILVIPLSAVSIFLIIMQPVSVGTWSTPALITAVAMLVMIPLTVDEVVAMGQFVLRRIREGEPFWRTFFKGGTVDGGGPDERSPHYPTSLGRATAASQWGMSLPWTLLAATALGVALMAMPDVLGLHSAEADSTDLVGSLVVCFAVIAMAEVARAIRYLNLPLGLWAVVSTFVLPGSSTGLTFTTIAAGTLIAALSVPRGPVHECYGTAQPVVQ